MTYGFVYFLFTFFPNLITLPRLVDWNVAKLTREGRNFTMFSTQRHLQEKHIQPSTKSSHHALNPWPFGFTFLIYLTISWGIQYKPKKVSVGNPACITCTVRRDVYYFPNFRSGMHSSIINETEMCQFAVHFTLYPSRYFAASFNIVLGITATSGNALIIVAILKSRKLWTQVSTYFIMSLSVADFLVGSLVQPTYAVILLDWSQKTCSIFQVKLFFGFFTCSISVMSAVLVCLDRMLQICYPFAYERYATNRRALITVGLNWICGGAIGYISVTSFPNEKVIAFGTLAWIFNAVVVGIFSSVKIYSVGKRQIKDMSKLSSDKEKKVFKERKLAVSLILVLCVVIVCWIPFSVYHVYAVYMYQKHWRVLHTVRMWTITVGYANSSLNILIFSFRNRQIKKAIKNLLHLNKNNERQEINRLEKSSSIVTVTSSIDLQGPSDYGSLQNEVNDCDN